METLRIEVPTKKEEIIKLINKHRLENKNKWYQVVINYSPYVFKIKAYNTWIQIFRTEEDGKIKTNNSSSSDISVTDFKNFLQNNIV